MNKVRSSVFVKIAFGMILFYVVYSACFFVYSVDRSEKREAVHTLQMASNYLKIGRILLREGLATELASRLSDAVDSHDIDYFAIRKNGVDIAYGNAAGIDDPIVFSAHPKEGLYETETYRHSVILQGPYELTIGHKHSPWVALRFFWNQERDLLLKDIALVVLLSLSITLYNFRDFRKIIAGIRRRGFRRGDSSMAKSTETLALVQGLKGYESNIESLAFENSLLKNAVLPALKKEIFSGRKPPYEFGCTVVRTDINNFTSIFSSEHRVHFMQVINDFFVDLTHIVGRYNGFVYEFIGDEVIFYFKDEDFLGQTDGEFGGGVKVRADSSAIAIAALRDVHELAEKVNEACESEKGYSFRIKTSLSYGLLRFGPLVDGYSLAGVPLIETVRLLSTVSEKATNVALLSEDVRTRIGDLCLIRNHQVVMLKGLPGSRRTHIYEGHIPLNHHLRQATPGAFEAATFFRSDRGVAEVLEFVRSQVELTSGGRASSSTENVRAPGAKTQQNDDQRESGIGEAAEEFVKTSRGPHLRLAVVGGGAGNGDTNVAGTDAAHDIGDEVAAKRLLRNSSDNEIQPTIGDEDVLTGLFDDELDDHVSSEMQNILQLPTNDESYPEPGGKSSLEAPKALNEERVVSSVIADSADHGESALSAGVTTKLSNSSRDESNVLAFARPVTSAPNVDRALLLQLLGGLRAFRVVKASVDVKNALLQLIESLLVATQVENPAPDSEKTNLNVGETHRFLLASTISAVPHLIPAASFTGRIRDVLLECLRLGDKRAIANTLDVFAELDPEAGDVIFSTPSAQEDNRVAGNRLVKEGKRDWSRVHAKQLRKMLKHVDPFFKASGLYALGEISQHLLSVDHVAYSADRPLQLLIDDSFRLALDFNRMVRRQALRAIVKSRRVDDFREFLEFARRDESLSVPEVIWQECFAITEDAPDRSTMHTRRVG